MNANRLLDETTEKEEWMAAADIFSLAYASEAAIEFDEPDLSKLGESAAEANQKLGVTGYLCYLDGEFFQYLEGAEAVVLELMEKIRQDERHKIRSIQHLGTAAERRFPNWSMRFIATNSLYEIRLEHVLRDILVNMKKEIYGEDRLRTLILGVVTRLSELRSKIKS